MNNSVTILISGGKNTNKESYCRIITKSIDLESSSLFDVYRIPYANHKDPEDVKHTIESYITKLFGIKIHYKEDGDFFIDRSETDDIYDTFILIIKFLQEIYV